MRAFRPFAGALVLGIALSLSACVPNPEVTAIEVNADDLQGTAVTVAVNQVVYVNTSGSGADVESYTAEIADDSIAEFVPGRNAGDFATYPGFTALKPGSTEVTLTGDLAIQPLEFTIEVSGDAR